MPSLFDPALTTLGFKRFFAIVSASASVTSALLVREAWIRYPNSTIALDLWFWWHESTTAEKIVWIAVALCVYVGILFYASIATYDYLLQKRADQDQLKR